MPYYQINYRRTKQMETQEQETQVDGFDLGLDNLTLDLGTDFETGFDMTSICEI